EQFRFFATVSDRGQIFIPKALQNYFRIQNRDKVTFVVEDDGKVVFRKKRGGDLQ
ncbi:MAG: AbrB/MazE/SpoVT family DNA-binding domain-containing protein, partial [Candidatus Omnitrophica bacterium]|nr:AbrB/MazE/SpoVT family DNA-binding domain-containing protein [Candidatus Omnitrophota bacterium]